MGNSRIRAVCVMLTHVSHSHSALLGLVEEWAGPGLAA